MLEVGLALVDEGVHAFLLVGGGKHFLMALFLGCTSAAEITLFFSGGDRAQRGLA